MVAIGVTREQRFSQDHPCPICNGHDRMPRGRGERCNGYLSGDGDYAHCSREEYAGNLPMHPTSGTYAHKLTGDCRCGKRHDPNPPPPPRPLRAVPQPRVIARYDYRNDRGELVYQIERMDPKSFRARRPDPRNAAGWVWNLDGIEPVPYRLPEVLRADRSAPIFIVEGEKDADRLHGRGFVASCNHGGADKWRDTFAAYFTDRRIVIIPDNDGPGKRHAGKVAAALHGIAASVRILELPDLPEHGDVSDWFELGGKAEDLRRLADAAPEWSPPSPDQVGPLPAPDNAPDPNAYHQTDTGNAKLLAALRGDDLRYDHKRGDWLIWVGPHWRRNAAAEVHALSGIVAERREGAARAIGDAKERAAAVKFARSCESKRHRDNLVSLASYEPPIKDSGDGWDADPLLLAVANGVIDLRTGTLREGRRDDRLTMRSPVVYDPAAAAPRWERFLSEVFGGDRDLIAFIRRAIGYSLTGETGEQVLFVMHGTGANGKGTLLDTVAEMLGDYAHEAPAKMLEWRAGDAVPNDMAALPGKRFVTARELPEQTTLNESRIKALTGEDTISARFLHKEFFTFRPVAKYFLMFNNKPEVRDDSEGFWRRVRLIPFGVQFPIDHALRPTLRAELPGILAWAVGGALEWRRDGLTLPATIRAATNEYRAESDPIGQFVEACCATAPGASVNAGALYVTYENWEHGRDRSPMTQTAFGRRMAERYKKVRTPGGNVYAGIGLRRNG